jgi:ankyrin repeat protein
MLAARGGHSAVVRELHLRGASLEDSNVGGCSALYCAVESRSALTVGYLLEHLSADQASRAAHNGWTPLMVAAEKGHLEIVRMLLEKSPEAALARRPDGANAFHTALAKGHLNIAEMLAPPDTVPQQAFTDLVSSELHIGLAWQYHLLGLPITDRTSATSFNDSTAVPPGLTYLGNGSFNSAFAVTYRRKDGDEDACVFKPLPVTETSDAALSSGIPRSLPRIANRNLATCDVAAVLGFDVIAETHIGAATMPEFPHAGPRLGLVMEDAEGWMAILMPGAFDNPDVVRKTIMLQLVDHLVGQVDRNPCNYFVKVYEDGFAKITGIDNDYCFGARLKHPDSIRYVEGHIVHDGFRGTEMPPVVDTEMARAILAVDPVNLNNILESYLDSEEISATLTRLAAMKGHIEFLQTEGLVIAPGDWAKPEYQSLLTPENSYAGRDRATATSNESW